MRIRSKLWKMIKLLFPNNNDKCYNILWSWSRQLIETLREPCKIRERFENKTAIFINQKRRYSLLKHSRIGQYYCSQYLKKIIKHMKFCNMRTIPFIYFIYWTTIKHNYRLLISMGKTIIIVSRTKAKSAYM